MSEHAETLVEMRDALGHLTAARDWLALTEQASAARIAFPDAWEPDYYEARGLIESGRYEDAEHILQLAMDRFPRNAMLTVLYGQAGLRFPDREDGIARWKMLLGHMPKLAQLHLGLAFAYHNADRIGDADHALADGLAQIPGNAQLLAGRAGLAWERQDWMAALSLWKLLLQLRPDRTDAYTFIVTALYKLNRPEESDIVAREGMARNPEDLDLASAYAMAAVARGDLAETADRWRRVLKISPGHIFASLGLSRAAQRQNQNDIAEMALREGLRHNPDSDVLLVEYATLATRARNWKEAAGRWSEAHLRCARQLAIYTPYVEALAKSGQLAAAEAMASEALGIEPADPTLLAMYASFAAARGDHAEALHRWQTLERQAPGLDVARHGIHDAQLALNRDRRAATESPRPKPVRTMLPDLPYSQPIVETPIRIPVPPPPPASASPAPPPPLVYAREPDPAPAPVFAQREPAAARERMPQMEPTALDMLFSGAPPKPPVQPAASEQVEPKPVGGLGSKLRRIFGRG